MRNLFNCRVNKKTDYQEERILEMIFLDVGQGNGCILTSPQVGAKEKIMIIDAGLAII